MVTKQGQAERKVIILTELVVLNKGEDVGIKIGTPVSVEDVVKSVGTNNHASSVLAPTSASNNNYNNIANKRKQPSEDITDGLTHPINTLSPYQNRYILFDI